MKSCLSIVLWASLDPLTSRNLKVVFVYSSSACANRDREMSSDSIIFFMLFVLLVVGFIGCWFCCFLVSLVE